MEKLANVLEVIPIAMERSFAPKTNYRLARIAQAVSIILVLIACLLLFSLEDLSATWLDFFIRGGLAVIFILQFVAFLAPMEEMVTRFRAQLKG